MPGTIMPSSGSIHRLEVDNFKSYKGHQVIGPFLNFTAIIGPNGAGKSNLMDAISFVLGVRSSHLRGSQLRDLVYAYDDKEREVRRKAHVKLVYLQGDGTELSFTRGITLQSASEYRIDDKVVSWDEYNNKMRSLGILVKARNFLVFQGDVESVSTKSPKELTALFEHISTSDELTKDYEELDSKREQAVQRTMFSYQKKKTTSGERKQKKEQKEEAEKHLALQEDLTKLKTEHFLYQLFNIDRDIKGTTAELEALNSELKVVEQEQGGVETEVKEKKKEQAKHSKEVLLAEKKAAKKKADAEKKQPDLVKLKEEIKRVEKNLQASEKGLTAKKAEHEKQVAEVQKLEQSLEQLTTLLEENEGEESSSKMDLATNQLAEYNRLKAEAGAKTAKLQKERDSLDAQQQTDLEAQRNLEDNISQLSAREQQLEGQEEATLERKKKIVEAMEEAKGTLAEKKREAEEMAERNKKARTRSVTLQGQIEKVEGQIAEARADLRLSERDRKAAEALEGMKRLYGHAVRGRLSDLCEPTQRKYQMAIAVAMGKNFDAIVVEDEKTAKDCIQYLKEQRAPVMTFIPLQTIKAKAVPEHLRALGGSAKLILDVLQYDASLEKAFLFACGQTLVCDTVEETRKLAYSSERHKVVALDGTLIAKNGNVTGGVSSGMEAKSKRWDDKAVEALEKKREAYEAEKAELGDPRQLDLALQELQTSIAGIERKLQLSAVSLEELEKKIAEIRSERKVNAQKQKSVQPELVQIRDAVSKREAAMAKLQARINEVKDRIFAEFSRGVGVASIREYEEKYLKEHTEMDERRLHLKNQIAKIKSQLEYERRRNTEEPVKQTKEQISEAKEELKELQQKLADVKEEVDAITAELDAITAEAQESKQKADAVEEEISALKKQISEKTQAAGKLKKQITAKETHIEQLKSVRSEVLEACELEQVPLPRVESDAAEDESEPMDVDSGEPSASEPATLRGTGIDYSSLGRKYQQPASGPEREKLESELRSRIEAMTAEMEKTAPNLKALDQYEQLRDKERGVVEEFEAARKEEKEITDEFNKVKNERYARFMAAFTHISTEIDSIYKQLTRDPDHPIGGTAYLSLENDEEPFLHGIKYTAMPPTKRFRNMEELSGGEKTVAALALLFAIHSFRPSPFFVLDEVDAALDNVNVARVAAYIHAKSRENAGQRNAGHSFQSVVISLKDTFFDKADGLIGVYRDQDQGCSRVLTKRLTTHD